MLTSCLTVASYWFVYGAIHSLLASRGFKAWVERAFPRAFRGYRAIYNTLAVFTLVPVLFLSSRVETETLWIWSGPWQIVSIAIAIAAAIGFLYSLRSYDMLAFLGVKAVSKPVGLATTGIHAWVRHPWYSLALVVIWTRDMDSIYLVQAASITVYILIGSRLEERRLTDEFGEVYTKYCELVPALIPRLWRSPIRESE